MLCAMAMAGLALSGAAAGGTVSAQFTGGSPWAPVTVTYTDVNNNRHSESTYAGLYWFQRTDTPGIGVDVLVGNTFSAFCMDAQESITWGPTYKWDIVQNVVGMAPSPTPPGGTITQAQLTTLGKLYSGYYNGGDFSSNVAAAGFGAAVWEIVWEHSLGTDVYNLTSGLFSINAGDVATQAQYYLDNLPATDAYAGNLVGLVSHGAQDQIVVVLTGGDNHAPEPLTVLGVLGSVAAIAAYIRRRRGQASGSTPA